MSDLLYKVLTSGVILISKLREMVESKSITVVRRDRDEVNRIPREDIEERTGGFILVCCDCRLSHRFFLRDWDGEEDEYLHAIPLRPGKYDYVWRWNW